MDKKVPTKTELWIAQINDFRESGLSRKQWCNDHHTALSTFNYWMRKLNEKALVTDPFTDTVFAQLPSVQEISPDSSCTVSAPITIYLSENIRIEIGSNCAPELMASLIRGVKSYV